MKVLASSLIEAFKHVDHIPVNSVLDSSQHVAAEAKGGKLRLKLTGIATAQAEIPCEGDISFRVDRRALGAFLNKVGDSVTCEKTERGKLLKSAGAKLEFAEPTVASAYADWKVGPGQKVILDNELLGLLCGYAPTTPSEVYSEMICLSKGYGSCATDGLVIAACLDKTVAGDCLLPKFISNLANRTKVNELWLEKTGIALRGTGTWLYQPLPAHKEPYPIENIKKVLESLRKPPGFLTIDPGALLEALRHLKSYSWADSNAAIHCTPVAGSKGKEKLLLRVDTPQLKADYSVAVSLLGSAPAKWSWPLAALLPWLEYVNWEGAAVTAGIENAMRWFRVKEEDEEYGNKVHLLVVAGSAD